MFKKKLDDWLAAGKKLDLKKNCIYDDIKGIQMKCVVCNIFLPRTPEFFNVDHRAINFINSPPGHEYLVNSPCKPCKKCLVHVVAQKRKQKMNSLIEEQKINSTINDNEPKQKRQKRNIDDYVKMFQDKLKKWLDAGKELILKRNCIYDNIKGIQMKCVVCKVFLPYTPEFFNLDGRNCEDLPPGREYLRNSRLYPCIKCRVDMTAKKLATKDGFITSLLGKYADLNKKWIFETLEKQNNRGKITNTILNLTTNSQNCLGIHRLDNKKEHVPENCFLEVQELNSPQYDVIKKFGSKFFNILLMSLVEIMIKQIIYNYVEINIMPHQKHLESNIMVVRKNISNN